MFHVRQQIPVAIRIDKGPVIRDQGLRHLEAMRAIVPGGGLTASLLNDLATGQRVVIQVGHERGNIRVNGSAAAIKDFRQRI